APSPAGSGQVKTTFQYDPTNFNLTDEYYPGGTRDTYSYSDPNSPWGGSNPYNVLFETTTTTVDSYGPSGPSGPSGILTPGSIRTTKYTYYDNGNLKEIHQIVGASDAVTSFTYTDNSIPGIPAGLIASVMDPNGNLTTYAYYTKADSETQFGTGKMIESGLPK